MNKLKLMGVIATFIAGSFFATNSQAQEIVTVQVTPNDYNQIVAQNPIGGTMVEADPGNMYHVVPGGGYPPTDPTTPLCMDQYTAAFAARMQNAANQCCCRVHFCVRRSNCAFYIMYVDPNNLALCPPVVYQYADLIQARLAP
jgi:hypothetical protein